MSRTKKLTSWIFMAVDSGLARELFLTILFSARVDDFGGNYMERVYKHLQVILGMIDFYNASHDTEVMIVEWNPLPGRRLTPALKDALRAAKPRAVEAGTPSPVRVVTVPPELSQSSGYHNQQLALPPFNDCAAKNVGGRRARGRFLLLINPDDLLSWEMGAFLFRRQEQAWHLDLDPNAFYVTGMRNDLLSGHALPGKDFREILTLAQRRVATYFSIRRTVYEFWQTQRPENQFNYQRYNYSRLHGHHCTGSNDFMGYIVNPEVSSTKVVNTQAPPIESEDHNSAYDSHLSHDPNAHRTKAEGPIWGFQAGDFILVATAAFNRARGFVDIPAQAHGPDDALLYKFRAANMTQRVLLPPCFVIHQHHSRSTRLAGFVDPYYIKRVAARDPYGLKRLDPMQSPPRSWGLPGKMLSDTILTWPD